MKTICIIEDEEMLLSALHDEMGNAGYRVISAKGGREGLELAKTEHPDIILLDILLPEMDGFEVLQRLKDDEQTESIPVLILSNIGQKYDIQKGLELGAVAYLEKSSTDINNITEKVKEIIGAS
jgi:two-component system, OmpR family, alkaline phosphatase synthesis response regulator PhoP